MKPEENHFNIFSVQNLMDKTMIYADSVMTPTTTKAVLEYNEIFASRKNSM
jgi:hypothetical protein